MTPEQRERRLQYEAALAAPIRRPPTFLGTGGLWMLLDSEARCETWVSVYGMPETPTCYPGDAFMRIRMPGAA
jgi:hypothetical protein